MYYNKKFNKVLYNLQSLLMEFLDLVFGRCLGYIHIAVKKKRSGWQDQLLRQGQNFRTRLDVYNFEALSTQLRSSLSGGGTSLDYVS